MLDDQRLMNTTTMALCGAVGMLFLAGCGGGGSGGGGGGGSEADVKAAVTTLIQGRDCTPTTAEYRKSLTGETDVKACSHDLSLRNKVKSFSIGAVKVSGDSATAAVVTDGDHIELQLVQQDGAWLVSGDQVGETSDSASTTETTVPTTTSTPTGADPAAARADLATALATYRAGRKRFEKLALADIRSRNLPAVKGDFSQFRDVVFNFDAQVRAISFPDSASTQVTALLEANRAEIADLDSVGAASGFSDIQTILVSHFKADDIALGKAVAAVESGL